MPGACAWNRPEDRAGNRTGSRGGNRGRTYIYIYIYIYRERGERGKVSLRAAWFERRPRRPRQPAGGRRCFRGGRALEGMQTPPQLGRPSPGSAVSSAERSVATRGRGPSVATRGPARNSLPREDPAASRAGAAAQQFFVWIQCVCSFVLIVVSLVLALF